MKARVAINGFGRIGRTFLRASLAHPDFEVVAVNASYDSSTLAHLLKYDTVHGRFGADVQAAEGKLIVDGRTVMLTAERDPAKLPWAELDIDIVIEATGKFRDRDGAGLHLGAGARKVIITAPGKNEDVTIVYGVNTADYDPDQHHIIAAASCTTNCLAPVVQVLQDRFGIEAGLLTTVHSYTTDQNFLDNPHRDLRRARAGALCIAPTSTGAAEAVAKVIPSVAGRMTGFALRVPTPNVSVVDLTVTLQRETSADEVNAAFAQAAAGDYAGIIAYSTEPLVSTDYIGDSHSAIVDGLSTLVTAGNLVKVLAWYDNEWGYSCRLADLAAHVARTGTFARERTLAAD